MSTNPPPLPPKPQAKAVNCPQCGAAITLRALGQASAVVCESCHAILDAKDPQLQILQKFEKIVSDERPLIPLGSRGKLRGVDYEVIGFERRSIKVDGITYSWREYLLFNPYKGFRYLSEYSGHWNDISVCKALPVVDSRMSIPSEANYLGEMYRHFQTSDANTDFVLGEFPWQVRVGERAQVTDYVHPPRVLSREVMAGEITWSIGEYMTGHDIWSTFRLPGSPPEAIGVYENQPSPFSEKFGGIWKTFAAFALALIIMMIAFEPCPRRSLSSALPTKSLPASQMPKPLSSPTSSNLPDALLTSRSRPPPTCKTTGSISTTRSSTKTPGRLGILAARSATTPATIAMAVGRKGAGTMPWSCPAFPRASITCASNRKSPRYILTFPTTFR